MPSTATAGSSSSSSSSRPSSSSEQPLSKSLSDVPVYVAPPRQHQQYDAGSEEQQQQAVHELVGYIMVHMDDSAADVYRTIQVGHFELNPG
jgi:hypothetical protein